MFFNLHFDLSSIQNLGPNSAEAIAKAMERASAEMTMRMYEHIREKAKQELHSTLKTYLDNLPFPTQVDSFTWRIELGEEANWIEGGSERREMIDDLVKSSSAKISKKGDRYVSVPFEHKRSQSNSTPAQYDLSQTIRSFIRNHNKDKKPEDKVPYGNIEYNSDGTPKLGLLHKFSIHTGPVKTHEGPWQGHGKVGDVRKGWSNSPFLQGIKIYQKQVEDSKGRMRVERNILTFRTASTAQKGTGMWVHPGTAPKNFFEEATHWAESEWENNLSKIIMEELDRNLK